MLVYSTWCDSSNGHFVHMQFRTQLDKEHGDQEGFCDQILMQQICAPCQTACHCVNVLLNPLKLLGASYGSVWEVF